MDKLFVIIGSILLIGFIIWWFFGKHKTSEIEAKMSNNDQEAVVTVSGGYTPNVIVFKRDVPAKIIFDRKDPSGCFSEVVFPDFGIHEKLPIGERYSIEIDTSKPGKYQYACGMNMFHGKVVIE